ncbi:MAG: hypothetical protein CMH57_06045 [Myxococcales bacterium]|nr:hypothetical protein [Myxococcales bacterium]
MHYQLRHCRDMFDVEAVILADRRGLMVAAADEEAELSRVLSAYAPLLTRASDRPTQARIMESINGYLPSTLREQLSVRRFDVMGEELFLCTLGGCGARKEMATCRAVSGVRRIVLGMTEATRRSAMAAA